MHKTEIIQLKKLWMRQIYRGIISPYTILLIKISSIFDLTTYTHLPRHTTATHLKDITFS